MALRVSFIAVFIRNIVALFLLMGLLHSIKESLSWRREHYRTKSVSTCTSSAGHLRFTDRACERCVPQPHLYDLEYRANASGRWHVSFGGMSYHRDDNSRLWHASDSYQCLKNRHVVFIGDSVTRFQYVDFIHFLALGTWPTEGRPSVCFQGAWAGNISRRSNRHFHAFNRNVSKLLGSRHILHWKHGNEKYEFRHYYDPAYNLKVTYIGWYGGHYVMIPFDWEKGPTPYGYCVDHPLKCWNGTVLDTIAEVVPLLCPTELIVNGGIWGQVRQDGAEPFDESFLQKLAVAGRKAVRPSHGRAFWRTTTFVSLQNLKIKRQVRIQKSDFYDLLPWEVFRKTGWGIINAGKITRGKFIRSLLIDDLHFRCAVYNAMNSFILDVLCR